MLPVESQTVVCAATDRFRNCPDTAVSSLEWDGRKYFATREEGNNVIIVFVTMVYNECWSLTSMYGSSS